MKKNRSIMANVRCYNFGLMQVQNLISVIPIPDKYKKLITKSLIQKLKYSSCYRTALILKIMREIKFRGLRKCRNRWGYGGISIFENEATIFDCNCIVNSAYEVEINSVGQFTGLQDKNGIDIYEGDIVQLLSGRKTAIEFNNSGFGYYSEFEKDTFIGFANHNNFEIIMKYIKVIGNIHENPELLSTPTAVL